MARRAPPGGPRKKQKRKIPRIRADTYEEVLDRFFDGDVPRSLDRFAALIRDDPSNPDGHAGLGFAFSWAYDSIGALRHLKKARHLGDERPYTLLAMGNAYKLIDMHDEAAECFRAALAARPDFAPAHANMAYLHAKRGAHQDAVESADRAREHDESSEAEAVKGIALLKMGMRGEADAVLAEAGRDNPESPHVRLAACYALLDGGDARGFLGRVKDAPGALAHFRKALKLGDDRAETRLHMGNACRMLDMHGEALECYRAALDRRPDLAPAHFGMAYTHAIRGDYQEAAKSADEVLRHDGLLDEAGTIKGIALLNAGRREGALGLLAGAERADPGSDQAKIGLGYALLHDGDEEAALRRFDGVVGGKLLDLEGHFERGRALSRRGDHAGAYEAYAAATASEHAIETYARMAASFIRAHSADPGKAWRAEALELALKAAGKDMGYALSQYKRFRSRAAPARADASVPRRIRLKEGTDMLADLDVPGALSRLKALVEDEPDFGEGRAALGMSGDTDGALAELREALRLGADEPEVYHNMGAVYDMAGMKKEARECRRRAGSVAR